jgi:pimeloyl-ACP methyl ester carboxylesterase
MADDIERYTYTIDMRKDYTKLDVPVYFFLGRYDINAPTSLVEEYLEVLGLETKPAISMES